MQNIEQMISMYWEADRSTVRHRYNEMFGFHEEAKIDEEGMLEVKEEASIEDNLAEDNEQFVFKERPDDEMLDREVDLIFARLEIPDTVRKLMAKHWQGYSYRTKIVQGNYLAEVAMSDDVIDMHAVEGICKYSDVQAASYYVHCLFPDVMFPIDLELSYYRLKKIINTLGIEYQDDESLSPFTVWLNISDALYDFAEKHGLETWQLFALVYDFGPRLLSSPGRYPTDQLQRIWIVATNNSAGEFEDIDAHGSENVGAWAANKNARYGDLALMYCVSPRSAIVSIYRFACDAYYDPFGSWNGFRGELTDKIAIPWIRISEMKKDEVLKEWRLVKCNFQGLLNHEVPSEIWQRIKEIVKQTNAEISEQLDQFANAAFGVRMIKISGEKWCETEVEERLIIPVLRKIGWELGKNLARQVEMMIKVGSGKPHKVKADFVGYRSALASDVGFVLETKRQIANTKDLQFAREQAESYAGKLRCGLFAVASPEGFWLYELRFPGQSSLLAELTLSEDVTLVDVVKLKQFIGREVLCFDQ